MKVLKKTRTFIQQRVASLIFFMLLIRKYCLDMTIAVDWEIKQLPPNKRKFLTCRPSEVANLIFFSEELLLVPGRDWEVLGASV